MTGPYRTRTSTSPWAGAVGPARLRSRPVQDFAHPAGRPSAPSDLDQAPDDVADHVVQEAVGGDADRRAARAGPPPAPTRTVQVGVRSRPAAAQKAREVVLAAHEREPRRHRAHVEREAARATRGAAGTDRRGGPDRSGRRSACPRAERRASKPAGASRASSTRTAGGNRAFSARCSAAGATADAVERLATWRSACTPASVRLAPVTFTGPPEHPRGRLHQEALHGGAARAAPASRGGRCPRTRA